ncbi:glycosyltransferase family 39 protein, partial [Streptomyces sp. NPDC002343]
MDAPTGATSRPPVRERVRRAAVPGVPALVMLVLGLWRLDRDGMWRDEAVSFQVGRRTVPQIWRLLHDVDAVHGLYYLLLHAVLAVPPVTGAEQPDQLRIGAG